MERRQLWATPQPSAPETADGRPCPGLTLPAGGVIAMPDGDIITLTGPAAFKPVCAPVTPPAIIANGGGGSVNIDDTVQGSMSDEDGITYSDFRDPFYASTFPQCYALAATTVVAYTLVIMLLVTPRSFLDGGVVVLGRKGFTSGGSGPSIGGRPWLQKVAALSVAISLTIASAATFRAAEEQYSFGVQNAKKLQMDVLGGNVLKIIRIVSQTFLWLAQAQTLIRLFPRQREKVIIKWTAFALITLDVIFQSLNSLHYHANDRVPRPGSFQDAIPALSYLFALSLGVLYAAWVIYYSLLKKRYAFWHPQMKNMCLMAVLSFLAILIPIVFFILDISKPDFTGWGEYVRWVGAAGASVVVWEWVERIEALEREEKKDGILGREVFDGDEMLEMTSSDGSLARKKKGSSGSSGSKGDGGNKEISIDNGRDASPDTRPTSGRANRWSIVTSFTARYRSQPSTRRPAKPSDPSHIQSIDHDRIRFLQPPLWPARPAPAVTPISRTDTASAASTVYAIRYHPLSASTTRTTPPPVPGDNTTTTLSPSESAVSSQASDDRSEGGDALPQTPQPAAPAPQRPLFTSPLLPLSRLRDLAQRIPFSRSHRAADEEHAAESNTPIRQEAATSSGANGSGSGNKWDFRGRFEDFAAVQVERLRERFRPIPDTDSLPVTVIPAPPRRGAALAEVLAEQQAEEQQYQHQQPAPPPQTPLSPSPGGQIQRRVSTAASVPTLGSPVPPPLSRPPPLPPTRAVGAVTAVSPVAGSSGSGSPRRSPDEP
ncbi:hypothetical protein VTK26DRAFT_541 [Humicola hyalothermophila]